MIDPEELIKGVTFHLAGKSKVLATARLATDEEIKEDKTVRQLTNNYGVGYWMTFVSNKALPKNSQVSVKIKLVNIFFLIFFFYFFG